MPRIVVFGKSQRLTRKVRHIIGAFRDFGNETLWINPTKVKRFKGDRSDAHILEKVERFKPDIVFIHSMDIPLGVLGKIAGTNIKTVQYYHDGWRVDLLPELLKWGTQVDLFLSNAQGLHERYVQAGIPNPVFILEGCDVYDHRKRRPLLPLWKSDVAFVGEARPNEKRVELIQKISGICRVRVYGKNWGRCGMRATLKEVGPRRYGLICGGAKIVLGIDAVTTIEGHWTNRLWITLGCGGFHLTNYIPGMEKVFTNREHLVWYHDEEECMALIREYLARPQERRRIAEAGYRHVHQHHTFHHFAATVLSLCEGIPKGE